jgi:hypothetical protein
LSRDVLPAGPVEEVAGLFSRHWRLNPVIELHWRDWGAESVVIECRSGDTLLFDPLSAATMAAIESGTTDFDELGRQMAGDLGLPADDPTLNDALRSVLERVFRLGWIEPAQGPHGPQGATGRPSAAVSAR